MDKGTVKSIKPNSLQREYEYNGIVYKKYNKDYFNLILEFKKISGVGCLLNTSFNVHGEPIVNSPKDAIKTLLKTNLKYLLIDNFLISKK